MQFQIEGISVVTLDHTAGEKTSKYIKTDFNLSVSKNLDKKHFIDKNGYPTEKGTKALTQCFVQGLIGNIHNAHKEGFWDSAEHLRYIIAELEKGFVAPANVSKSTF